MTRKPGAWIAIALAGALASTARAELPEEGVANGRFAEFVALSEGGFVSGAMSDEPGQAGSVTVSVSVDDFATGFWAYGEGLVPAALATLTADHARASFDLAQVPGFVVQACGYGDAGYGCGPMTEGRIELTLSRTGDASRENGTSVQELPDGSARRVTRAGWTSAASVAGTVLGRAIPADASAKIGSYHLLVVSRTPAK
jgi:hypothetical protein